VRRFRFQRILFTLGVVGAVALVAYRRAQSEERSHTEPSHSKSETRHHADADRESIHVVIDGDGRIFVDGQEIATDELTSSLEEKRVKGKGVNLKVDVDPGGLSAMGSLVGALKSVGVESLSVNIKPAESEGSSPSPTQPTIAPAVPPVPAVPAVPAIPNLPTIPPIPPMPVLPGAKASQPDHDDARAKYLKGDWTGTMPKVNLDLDHERARSALASIADQAKWTIVFKERPSERVDLTVHGLPADEAMLLVLQEIDSVVADRQGNVITIREMSDEEEEAASSAEEAAEAEAERQASAAEEIANRAADAVQNHTKDDRVSLGGSVTVEEGETVRDAVAMGGGVTVKGLVLRDAVAMGGGVHITSTGEVRGDTVSMGGAVKVDPGGKLRGSKVTTWGSSKVGSDSARSEKLSGVGTAFHMMKDFVHGLFGSILGALTWFVILFVMSLLVITFAPARAQIAAREIVRHPLPASLVGFMSLIALIPLTLLLLITIVGPIVLWVLVFAAVCLGYAGIAQELGQRLPILRDNKTPVLSVALGSGVFAFATLIPIIGTLVVLAAIVVCLGAAVRTRFGQPLPVSQPAA
jgi:biopolymer transport protein ExbD